MRDYVKMYQCTEKLLKNNAQFAKLKESLQNYVTMGQNSKNYIKIVQILQN